MLNSVVAVHYIWIVWFVVIISSCCSRVVWLWVFVYCFPGCLLFVVGLRCGLLLRVVLCLLLFD